MQKLDSPNALIRRPSNAADPLRKPGWQVHTSVADRVREAVSEGAAHSQNALVEAAIIQYLSELRRQALFDSYAEAAADPEFVADMAAVSRDFDPTVSDGLS